MSEQEAYNKVKQEANNILSGIGLHWDDLADSVSIWDWVDEDMSEKLIKNTAKDVVWDKLTNDGMPNSLATNICYGE
tara:strand:+ start:6509 stop:6739 length:231 start_codon:yes stop_codon:yes gene_type:complete